MNRTCRENDKLFMFPHDRDPVASIAYCVGNLGEVLLKASRATIVICLLVFALAACFGQAPASDTSLSKNTIFQKNCAKCHGKTAEGRHFGGPSLISDKVSSADDLRRIITNGKGRMPRYASKLTSEEIDTLVLEIETLNKR
jgi:mono/diheme cytochrome c family protein